MDFIEPWNSTWHFGSRLCRKKGVGIEIETRRMRGRPKRRWLDKVRDDIRERNQSMAIGYNTVEHTELTI